MTDNKKVEPPTPFSSPALKPTETKTRDATLFRMFFFVLVDIRSADQENRRASSPFCTVGSEFGCEYV